MTVMCLVGFFFGWIIRFFFFIYFAKFGILRACVRACALRCVAFAKYEVLAR